MRKLPSIDKLAHMLDDSFDDSSPIRSFDDMFNDGSSLRKIRKTIADVIKIISKSTDFILSKDKNCITFRIDGSIPLCETAIYSDSSSFDFEKSTRFLNDIGLTANWVETPYKGFSTIDCNMQIIDESKLKVFISRI